MLSTQFNRDNQHQAIIKPSLLAGCIALALLPSAAFAAPVTEETVIVEGSATAPDDGENDYNVTSTSAGTKMQMTQRDIPQSVTIVSQQRMEDQQLQTLGEVMENTLGISKSQADSDRALYYSRGFQIDNYMVDGIPTYFESRWNLGDALSDMALFERVEVVRGATGLMTGTGNPSAAINMVRKHATSREFKGDVSAEYGSWNKERYVADLQSPLTEDGKIRARIVGGYQNNDSWLDRYNSEKTFFSGIVDADLGDLTMLSAGYEYQRIDVNSPTWGGLPRWNTDGSSNSYDRARSTAPDWAYNDKEINKVFMTLKQRFADTWQATLNATHSEVEFDSKMMYVDAYVNKADGMLVGPYSNYGPGFDYVGGTGWNSGKRKVDALDLFADGSYELFGRQHAEDGVVNNGITDTDDREQPQFAAVTRQNDEVDQTVRERRTVTHPQKNTDWECQACQNRVDDVQDRRNEHEGELDRLGDTGQERGQRRGDHNTAHFRAVFWFSRVPDSNCGSWQTVHFEQEATRQFTRSRVTRHITRNVAVENLTCCVGVFTNLHLERYVPDVVQTKRYQATFDETVNAKRNYRVLVSSPLREGLDCRTNRRPNEGQHNASKDGSQA